jgi:hypothetical protein
LLVTRFWPMAIIAAVAACGPSSPQRNQPISAVTAPPGPDPSLLRLGRDSFALRFNGMPGGEVHEYARTATGYRYTSAFSTGTFQRELQVDFDSSLHVTRARHTTTLGRERGEADVAYAGLHARGHAVPLQASARGPVAIDTDLPAGAFDGLALYPMLLSRRWSVGQEDTLVLFDTDELSVSRQQFRVAAAETLALGGASMRALRAELSTTQLPVTLWLSEAYPHRLLRMRSGNGVSELVR